jgi:hypothetical protein
VAIIAFKKIQTLKTSMLKLDVEPHLVPWAIISHHQVEEFRVVSSTCMIHNAWKARQPASPRS